MRHRSSGFDILSKNVLTVLLYSMDYSPCGKPGRNARERIFLSPFRRLPAAVFPPYVQIGIAGLALRNTVGERTGKRDGGNSP